MGTKYKTIRISVETYDKLTREGTVRDSFDDVIGHLLGVKDHNTKMEDMER